ncbi:hypothetical protein C8J56DRAFT_1045813 [Mycena floridula]|nr:hypothetical protein C8J56DRAFT_1045813 [Mycena floridula]
MSSEQFPVAVMDVRATSSISSKLRHVLGFLATIFVAFQSDIAPIKMILLFYSLTIASCVSIAHSAQFNFANNKILHAAILTTVWMSTCQSPKSSPLLFSLIGRSFGSGLLNCSPTSAQVLGSPIPLHLPSLRDSKTTTN